MLGVTHSSLSCPTLVVHLLVRGQDSPPHFGVSLQRLWGPRTPHLSDWLYENERLSGDWVDLNCSIAVLGALARS